MRGLRFWRGFSTRHTSLLERYGEMVERGEVKRDEHQLKALRVLEDVATVHEENGDVAAPLPSSLWLSAVFKRPQQQRSPTQRKKKNSVYLYGTVGTGKSFLMDFFFDNVSESMKKRVHFHAFMLDVHKKIHRWRVHERGSSRDDDPIPPVAKKLRAEARLLCFDEFQVTDVADAMILKRLFVEMFGLGMRFVVTSNRPPADLYLGGLNRPLFVPFIENVLEKEFFIVNLSSGNDYRLTGQKALKSVYLVPLNEANHQEIQRVFASLSHSEPISTDVPLAVFGSRKILVPVCARGVCLFTFDQLIRASMGASDYLAIAKNFHTVILEGIPKMTVNDKELARRFITFIDALYEHKCKFICSAEDVAGALFPKEEEAKGAAHEEVFAFHRAVSRLHEMGTQKYLQQAHRSD